MSHQGANTAPAWTWMKVLTVALLLVIATLPVLAESDDNIPAKTSAEGRRLMVEGMAAYDKGSMTEAARLFEQARATYTLDLGPAHPETLTSMNNLAESYSALGRFPEALKLQEETLALRRRTLGAEDPATLTSMANLANSYYDLGRFVEALKLQEETLTLVRRLWGPEHPNTLTIISNVAKSYYQLGRVTEALKLNEETLTIRRRTLGAEHPDTLISMDNLAACYYRLGRFAEAVKLQEETLTLSLRTQRADHPDTLTSMANLAASYHALGRFAEAVKLQEQTVALRRRTQGDDHPDTLSSIHNLAVSYRDLGRLSDALKLQEETFALMRRKLGAEHPVTLSSMANLAGSYRALGRYAEALKLDEQTLRLRRRTLGDIHPDTLRSMDDLAVIYRDLGRLSDALKLQEETVVLMRRTLGADHPITLNSMANLAVSYRALGRFAEALELNEETLELRRRTQGPDHPDTLNSMANLAVSYHDLGRFAEALKLNEETLTLRRRTLGAEHPDTLTSMANLASSYYDLGRLDEALKLQEETLTLRRRILGPEHPGTLPSMNNLAYSYRALDRRPESLALRRESLEVIDRMATSLSILPRDERSTALALYQGYYSLLAQDLASVPTDYAEALAVTERAKARTLLEELTARQAIANSGIPADSAKRQNELRSQLEYIDGKLASPANDDTRKSLWVQHDGARAELAALHQNLMGKYPRYAALSAVKTVSLEQGRDLLPANGVFISWLFDATVSGVALALPKSGDLQVLSTTPGQQMIARAETFRWLYALPDADSFANAVQTIPLATWLQEGLLYIGAADKQPAESKAVPATQYMALRQPAITAHGQWLSDTLLKPLTAQIDAASQWILSPDGVLATIPWDTLPWKGEPLGQQKQLTVIQSLSVYKLLKDRETANMSASGEAPGPVQSLMVMGGAIYGNGPGAQRSFQRNPQIVINIANTDAAEYQQQSAYDYMRSRHWPNLAGSLNEAQVLHGLMTGQLFTGSDASETRLRELSQSGELARFSNLHFAAHGYLDTSVPSLSALVLTATGQDESNDGYITAGEWPAFNLNSDLLVMSACETGLGKIVSGEGVQGLPYALYVAGNRDTLLSLWQVSDNGTAVFMKRFWEKVSAGQNHAQALTETKREFQRGEFGKTYTEPYYWAPFVLYGVQE